MDLTFVFKDGITKLDVSGQCNNNKAKIADSEVAASFIKTQYLNYRFNLLQESFIMLMKLVFSTSRSNRSVFLSVSEIKTG